MGEEFDAAALFDDDDLFFAGEAVDARADSDVELLRSLLPVGADDRVLDLACGHGRIATRLAAGSNATVVGVDLSAVFLAAARRADGVAYVRADMRSLPLAPGSFDAAYSWHTAYGYFDDRTNRAVLRAVRGLLRRGGRFLLELNHRDELLGRWVPEVVKRVEGAIRHERHRFDPSTNRNHVHVTITRGEHVREFDYFVRMFSYTELRDWLLDAGFLTVAGFGPDRGALRLDSPRMLVVASA